MHASCKQRPSTHLQPCAPSNPCRKALLRRWLLFCLQISQGETFVTQTDTEVVPKLCKVVYNRLHKLDMQVTFTQVWRPFPTLLGHADPAYRAGSML